MSIADRDYVPAKLHDCGGKLKNSKGENADWYVYFKVRNPDTGEMHPGAKRGKINYCKTVRERRREGKWLVNLVNEMLAQGELSPFKAKEPELTLAEHLKKQFELFKARYEINGTLRKSSFRAYKGIYEIFTKWMDLNKLTGLLPREFTRAHAHGFCDYLIQVKKYGGVTFNTRKTYIGGYFNSLADREIVASNPFARVKPLPETAARHIPYTPEQVAEINRRLIEHNFQLFLFKNFIEYCFMRTAEVRFIQVRDIKPWFVVIYGDVGKTRVQRVADIPNCFRDDIKNLHLERYPDNYYLFGKGLKPGPVPISTNWPAILFKKLIKVPMKLSDNCTLYGFKHTGNQRARQLGISMKSLQGQNGHATELQTVTYMRGMGWLPNEEFNERMK